MKQVLWIVAAVLGVLVHAGTTHAQWTSGAACQLVQGQQLMNISTPPYGVGNNTTGWITVNCPLDGSGIDVKGLQMYYWDRNAGSNQDFACELDGWDSAGNLVSTYTFGSAGGGPGSGLVIKSVTPQPNSPVTGRIWSVKCSIPGSVTVSGTLWQSHILGFRLSPTPFL